MTDQTGTREFADSELEGVVGGIGQAQEIQHLSESSNHQTDRASPSLFTHCATGRHIPDVKLSC
jgi:type VI protein secretion system component Hcp